MKRGSIAQLLRNSDVLRARYTKHVRSLQLNPVWKTNMTSMYGAKHRFDTWAKPFSRIVLTFEAVLATAQEMHEERRHEETGRHAKHFLNLVDEEMMLSFAMMADAGEENLELVRFLDSENMSTTDIAAECHRFLQRITVLFEGRGCLRSGHTAFMLSLLQKERLLFIDHKAKRVGGHNLQRATDRCLERLVKWVRLAREVVRAEFPQFESVQAFAALRLLGPDDRPTSYNVESERNALAAQLTKLAALLRLDVNVLSEQFFAHLPSAQFAFDSQNCTSFAAWRQVVRATLDDRRRRQSHGADVLKEVLIRQAAWGASTSGVERLFGLQRSAEPPTRNRMEESYVRDELFLYTTKGEPARAIEELTSAAPEVWLKLYGPPRHHGGAAPTMPTSSPPRFRRRRRRQTGPRADAPPGTVKAFTFNPAP